MIRILSRKSGLLKSKANSLSELGTIFVLVVLVLAAPYVLAANNKKNKNKSTDSAKAFASLPDQSLIQDQAILQALNRLGFGPRPGDVERVKEMGLQQWVEQQLHPESINDDALNERLDRFSTLKMTSAQLLNRFPQPKAAAKREGVTVEEYRKKQQQRIQSVKQSMQAQNAAPESDPGMIPDSATDVQSIPKFDPGKTDPDANPTKSKGGGKGQAGFGNPMFNYQQVQSPQRIVAELSMAKVTRALYSERQLNEMMVDFWYNHFNVFAAKGADRWLVTSFERDAIRPYAMGKFRDLLGATAKSPAMLFFLDNWLSADPIAWKKLQDERVRRQERALYGGMPRFPGIDTPDEDPNNPNAKGKKNQDRGLNENYGRELMELHTLGVDGGYTQDDIINVAKAFTGWTIKEPRRDAEFVFSERLHDNGKKMVLGHEIRSGGIKDGEEVLDILARDPHTARHISFEIAQRFVADNPPDALVDRMAQTFLSSDGDIREVLRTMIYSPEFWSKDDYRAKIKTPFELVVSATRAVGAEVDIPLMLVQWTNRIGQPLYQCEPPTGYSDTADSWMNSGALLSRMNFSLALTTNRLRGMQVNVESILGDGSAKDSQATLDRTIQALLGGQVSKETRETIEKQLKDPQILQAALDDPVKQVNSAMIAGLVLGSPEFQRK